MFLILIYLIIGLSCCQLSLSFCNPDSAVRKAGIYGKPYTAVKVRNEVHCYKLCSYSKVCKAYNYISRENDTECQLLSSDENDLISSKLTATYILLSDSACTPFANTNPCDSKPCKLLETCVLIESGKNYSCIKNVIECGKLDLGDGMFMKFIASPALTHSTANYDCEIGYLRLGGSGISTCNTNGTWSPLNIFCQEIDCGRLTVSKGVEIKSLPSPARYNSIAMYECKYGYRYINGTSFTKCQADGRWGNVDLKCEKIQCETPTDIWQIAGSRMGNRQDAPFLLDTVQAYECIPNYNLTSGNGLSVCLSNSTWSRPDIECRPIVCGDLPTKSYAIPDDVPALPFVGTIVTYTCNSSVSNYVSGNPNITCLSSTRWSQLGINCARRCDDFPSVVNAVPSMFYIPSMLGCQVKYSCNPEYVASGNTTSTCTDEGWTSPNFSCQQVN